MCDDMPIARIAPEGMFCHGHSAQYLLRSSIIIRRPDPSCCQHSAHDEPSGCGGAAQGEPWAFITVCACWRSSFKCVQLQRTFFSISLRMFTSDCLLLSKQVCVLPCVVTVTSSGFAWKAGFHFMLNSLIVVIGELTKESSIHGGSATAISCWQINGA